MPARDSTNYGPRHRTRSEKKYGINYGRDIRANRYAKGGTFRADVVTIGDVNVMAQLEAMMPDFKSILAGKQRQIIRQHFVGPVKKNKLIKKSKRYKNLDSIYPRGRWWPRVYVKHPPKRGYGNVAARVQYNKKSSKRPYNFVSHRKYLAATTRVAKPEKKQPWNYAGVLWGNKSLGVHHAAIYMKHHGDYRDVAIKKFGPDVQRRVAILYQAVLKEHQLYLTRLGVQTAWRLTNPELLRTKIAKEALKRRSRSKAVQRRMDEAEHKGIAYAEKDKSLSTLQHSFGIFNQNDRRQFQFKLYHLGHRNQTVEKEI